MKAKKILYITPGLNIGGAEKFIITLANGLASGAEQQVMVSLVEKNVLTKDLDPSIQFIALPRRSRFDTRPLLQLRKLIREEKPDVIFCINFFTYAFSRLACFFRSSGCRRIISYHSTIHVNRKEYYMHQLYRNILTKRDLIVTVSLNQQTYTQKELRLPSSKFKTIHNGIDTDYWKLPPEGDQTRQELRAKYNIPADAKLIVKAASFRVEKNHLGAIKALHQLHHQYKCKAWLMFLGDGPMLEEVKKLTKELALDDYVVFAGMQPNVQPFYWAADLFTLTSTSVETFSIAALEAMASGLPCVLTDIGGASEMIEPGVNGYLCTPDEEDIAAKWHQALTRDFPKESIFQRVVERFSADKMVEEYGKIL